MRRPSSLHTLLALVASTCFLVACGDPDYRDDEGGGGITADNFAQRVTSAYCDYIERCAFANDDILVVQLFLNAGGDCESFFGPNLELDDLVSAMQSGRTTLNGALAEDCLADLSRSCIEPDTNPRCREVFTGTLAEGTACTIDEECQPGLYCDRFSSQDVCEHVCRPLKDKGEPCDGDHECKDGDGAGFCLWDDSSPNGRCGVRTVETGAAEGEACGLGSTAANTYVETICSKGLWCKITDEDATLEAGTCAEPVVAGQPCSDEDDVCETGAFCIAGSCRAVTVQTEAGASCSEQNLEICNPLQRLVCDAGSCRALGDGTEGSECASGDLGTPCNPGLFCQGGDDGETGECAPKLGDGAQCDSDSECESDFCNWDTGSFPSCESQDVTACE